MSSASAELAAAELAVAAEELGAGRTALPRISSSLFTLASLHCPAFQNARGIAPRALVELGRLAQGLLQPFVWVELLRLLQRLGDQRRYRADVRLVKLKDIVAARLGRLLRGRKRPAELQAA